MDLQTAYQKLAEISRTHNFPLDGLKRWFNDVKEQHRINGVADEETLNEMSINTILAKLRKVTVFGGGVELDVVFFGYSRVFDRYANLRQKALEAFSRDPNQAVMARVVDANGVPIFPPGHPNEGKPIPEPPESLSRVMLGLVKRSVEGKVEIKPFILTVRGEKAKEVVELFKPYKIVARVLNFSPDSMWVNLTSSENFTAKKVSDEQIKIKESYKKLPNFIKLKDVFDWHQKNKDTFGAWFVTEIDVDGITNPTTQSSSYIILADDWKDSPEELIRVVMNREVYDPVKYGKGSRLLLIGSTNEFPTPDGRSEIAIMGYGVYPLITVESPNGDLNKIEEATKMKPPEPPSESNSETKWE